MPAFVNEVTHKNTAPTEALRTVTERIRRLPIDDMLHRSEEVEKKLSSEWSKTDPIKPCKKPPEPGKLLANRAWLCWKGGRESAFKHYQERAVRELHEAGLEDTAERLLELQFRGEGRAPPCVNGVGFDHPVFWGAFQLVGRVV
jgi:CHAT domain-containing protein